MENENQAANAPQVILIDPITRTISVPDGESLFGVYSDNNVERKLFRCPKIVGDNIDLSNHLIFINYISSSGKYGQYMCEDVATDGDDITFSWVLSSSVFNGNKDSNVRFAVQAKERDADGYSRSVFNTAPATGRVLGTVDSTDKISQKHADVILQMLSRLDNLENGLPINPDDPSVISAISGVVDLEKYGIVQADYKEPFTEEQYRVAYQNGVGIQQAIDAVKASGRSTLKLPAGNYPLCYHAESRDAHNHIIDACGVDLNLEGCRLYVIYEEEGVNPYYTWTDAELEANGGIKNHYLLMGTVIRTDSDILGGEIIGERGLRRHENTKYRDSSTGIELAEGCNGNRIQNVRVHHISGDGISMGVSWGPLYISSDIACTSQRMDNGIPVDDTWCFLSARMGIAWNIDTTKPIHVCATGNTYFLWTSRPIKIHCFTKEGVYLGTVETKQGNPFYAPNGTFYVYVELRSGAEHELSDTANYTFRFFNGLYINTIIDGCDIGLNQRGGISNLPSGAVVRNCKIHDNGRAYGDMAAYFDGTQFGIDIEDWYIDRLTIENCHFFGQINDVLFRCNDLVVDNSVFKGYVHSLNYAVDVRLSHSHFYGTVELTTPASFGVKTAVGCEFSGSVSDAIQIVGTAEEQKTLTFTGAVNAIYDGSADTTVNIPQSSGGEAFIVRLSGGSNGISADKTFAEIKAAYEAGKIVVADIPEEGIFTCIGFDIDKCFFVCTGIRMDTLRTLQISINSNNTVTVEGQFDIPLPYDEAEGMVLGVVDGELDFMDTPGGNNRFVIHRSTGRYGPQIDESYADISAAIDAGKDITVSADRNDNDSGNKNGNTICNVAYAEGDPDKAIIAQFSYFLVSSNESDIWSMFFEAFIISSNNTQKYYYYSIPFHVPGSAGKVLGLNQLGELDLVDVTKEYKTLAPITLTEDTSKILVTLDEYQDPISITEEVEIIIDPVIESNQNLGLQLNDGSGGGNINYLIWSPLLKSTGDRIYIHAKRTYAEPGWVVEFGSNVTLNGGAGLTTNMFTRRKDWQDHNINVMVPANGINLFTQSTPFKAGTTVHIVYR